MVSSGWWKDWGSYGSYGLYFWGSYRRDARRYPIYQLL